MNAELPFRSVVVFGTYPVATLSNLACYHGQGSGQSHITFQGWNS
jgi:hypothetical protein